MALEVGELFGRYRIDAELGRGGMGRVYRAWDTHLSRAVALKVLRQSGEPVAELLREARSAASLHHPNAVAIHDVAEIEGMPVLIMELVDGVPLRALLGARAPLAARVGWLADLARVLAAAHRQGMVHRDVKPDNAVVTRDGVLKVLDFGIAKVIAPGAATPTLAGAGPAMTLDGTVKGTPAYMAPEQLDGAPIDGRADQYAWGVTAYEVLSGAHPSAHAPEASTTELTYAIHPPPLAATTPAIPAGLSAVVARAMAKSPGARFPSMDELVAALAAAAVPGDAAASTGARGAPVDAGTGVATVAEPVTVASGARAPTAVERPSRRRGRAVVIAALALVGVGGGVAVAVVAAGGHRRSDGEVGRAAQPPGPGGRDAAAATGVDPWSASGAPGVDASPASDALVIVATVPDEALADAAPRANPGSRPIGAGGAGGAGPRCAGSRDCDLAGGELCRGGRCQLCPPGREPAMGMVCAALCNGASDCGPRETCEFGSLMDVRHRVCIGCSSIQAWYAGQCRSTCGGTGPRAACLPPGECDRVSTPDGPREVCLPPGSSGCPDGQIKQPSGACRESCRDDFDCTAGQVCTFHECVAET